MTFTRILGLAALLLLALSTTANAYTDAEIDRMFNKLKAENQALRDELQQLRSRSKQAQEKKPDELSSQLVPRSQQQISSIKRSLDEQQETFRINGFLTAGATKADPAVSDQNNSFSDDVSFDTDSVVGLQATFQINKKTDVTVQMVARAAEDWEMEAEWAFLRYKLSEDLSFRAGRLRLPIQLFSESVEVGFSYPWVRPPSEVYSLPINNFEGVDFIYAHNFGDWAAEFQVFAGNDNDDIFQTNELYGANATLSSGPWTLRTSASSFSFDIDVASFSPIEQVEFIGDGGSYYTVAGMYDDGEWLLLAELSTFDADDSIIFRDSDAGYITVGKYFGKWMPHLTVAKSYTKNEPDPYTLFTIPVEVIPNPGDDPIIVEVPVSSETLEFTGTSYTLGLRYNITENTSAKMEWSHYTQFDDTGGIWTNLRFAEAAKGIDEVDIYSLVIDVVF
ncbi:hypothetical protein [Oceanicoccus sagamiensis]|uniref:Porin domain-containing protein n=1 Tax=Oceanicoccus sagamiensis TaxID=716816 RepID=A0A1X9NCX0_9GAMM|nr:hypothetical protein [Oceanicoccus sagamiensis]ARN74262.1 hypothetical protein BST96_09095 [Oceanicoccus sagamiensis]